MSELKATPGPWSTDCGEHTNGWFIVVDCDGHELGSGDGGFEEPDAHLIAAAPELYAALEHVMQYSMFAKMDEDSQRLVTAALAKARGES